jgi:hypothetical protein
MVSGVPFAAVLATGGRGVVVADIDEQAATQVAAEIGGLAVGVNVSVEDDLVRLVEQATARFDPSICSARTRALA